LFKVEDCLKRFAELEAGHANVAKGRELHPKALLFAALDAPRQRLRFLVLARHG